MRRERDWHRVRVLAVAGLIVLVPIVLLAAWAIGPVWSSLSQASDDADLAVHFQALTAQKPEYQKALAQAHAALAGQNLFYGSGSAELAAAQLQETAQNLVAQVGGQVRSSEIGAPVVAQGVQTINVMVDCSLPQDRLAPLLAAADAARPYLVVQALDVRSTDAGDRNAALDVQLTIAAFREGP